MNTVKAIGLVWLAIMATNMAGAWSHSPASQSFGTSGGSFTLVVSGTENYSWYAGSSESWISVSRVNATTFSVTVTENTDSESRSGNVTINAFQSGSTASAETWVSMQSCGITQAGSTSVRSVSPMSVSFDKTGGDEYVNVTVPSDETWSVSGGASWITANVSSGTGSGNVLLSATANTGVGPRSATLLIAGQSVNVYQSGEPGYSRITYSNLKSATHSNPSYYKEGETVTFTDPTPVDGYVFAGWTPAQIDAATTGDVEVVASWVITNDCSITAISAKQRWPWNGKVDIQYSVSGDLQKFASRFGYTLSLAVSAKDLESGASYSARTLTGDVSMDEGAHSVVWDLDADGISLRSTNIEFTVGCLTNAHTYCVIDISGGMDAEEFPISYLDEVPKEGWSQEYKTSKIVLRRVEASDVRAFADTWSGLGYLDGCGPYYIGVFEFTYGQAARLGWVLDDFSSEDFAEFLEAKSKHPIETWWETYRGSSSVNDPVADDSLLGKLNNKTKLEFDVPMTYQWVVANMADSVNSFYNFFDGYDKESSEYAWFGYDSLDKGLHEVGTKLPNSWGIYDTAGNCEEFCLAKWGNGTYAQYGYFCTYGGNCCTKAVSDLSWRFPGGDLAAALRLTWTLPEDEIAAALPSSTINGLCIDTVNVRKAPINAIISVGDSSISVSSEWGEAWPIYYTTDGSEPTASSSLYTNCIVVGVKGVTTIKTIAISSAGETSEVATLEIPAAPTPTISPADRSTISGKSLTVNISCSDTNAVIHYTTDGSEPTATSPVYKRFKVSAKTTIKAIAVSEGMAWSETATAAYAFGQCADPIIVPTDGTIFDHSNQQVTIAWESSGDGILRYTTDGSEPTAESPVYAEPFTISETTTVKAKVFSDSYFDSAVASVTLTRIWNKVATPVITAPTEFSGSGAEISIACTTEGATIYYTTDGSEPNSHSAKYTAPFTVTATTRIRAVAIKADWTKSEIADFTTSKEWSIGDSLGNPDRAFSSDATTGWVRDQAVSHDGHESMRSGAIGNSSGGYVESTISTVVSGKGTVKFWWKASCEEDEDYEWDHAEFWVDGEMVARINGVTEWLEVPYEIGSGEHTLSWVFLKDDYGSEGDDCVWLDGVSWEAAATPTEPIPDLGENPTETQIAEALAGSADEKIAGCITNATMYNAYREWAESVKGTNGMEAAGVQAVKDSPNAWVSFALGSDKLLEDPPKDSDLKVEEFEPTGEDGQFEFTVSVEGVTVGSEAKKENLKRVFGLDGASTLDTKAFSTDNVDLEFGTPENGKVKFTAKPVNDNVDSFFMRVKVLP